MLKQGFSRKRWYFCLSLVFVLAIIPALCRADETAPARDPNQPIDEAYTQKIHKYTTAPHFASPLVDYLPASKTVPTPEAVLGDIAGAPGVLPYAEDVYRYVRLLEKASSRVKVFSIGTTEEGREMIAVAISSEENLKRLEENRARLAKLADPRAIHLDDAEADRVGDSHLLHHRHDSLAGDRRADRADGAGLSPGGGRKPVYP